MNVALVVLDTLRKDAFDAHFDWLPGTRFENAYSTSHWTVPAHASLFAGKYPSELGVYAGAQLLDCPEPVLPESFHGGGYTTRAFSANVNISRPFDFHRGFDRFEGSWRLDALSEDVFDWDGFIAETRDMGPERYAVALRDILLGDCDTVPSLKRGAFLKLRDLGMGRTTRDDGATEALQFVRETDFGDDEFLFVNLMEAHTPYAPPEEFRTVDPPELDGLRATLSSPDADPDRIRRAYDDGVRYLADRYRAIFAELREEFDYVITLADHGEALGEYGAWEHLCGLYPEVTKVPLCIWSTDETETTSTRREEPVSLLDVHRTVLDIADLDGDSRGRNLLVDPDDADRTEWLVEYHGLTDRHRAALSRDGFDVEPLDTELHALVAPGYYGWETPDGFRQSGETEKPRERVETLVNELNRRVVSNDAALSPAVEEQLRDLGYA
ncbi:arylsulfatase [Haladaptatus sp. W1]|uniref:sulfatase-like hydrolase/transferase n=1 Tax=Haladaptatus sp. W1 TaxID=1897478 RepID=UPI000849A843|nr:sulfatase-like hydrolase/transferase [Haladaptatus sp. W1]ODR79574.1 arylsulfatase [Haladaptatus sp. W1]